VNYPVNPAGTSKTAIAELQGRKQVVLVGGDATTPAVLPGIVSQRLEPLLFSSIAFLTAGGPPIDKTTNCTMGSKVGTITAITLTDSDPVLLTQVAHGLVTEDVIRDIAGIVGTVELNGTNWVIAKVDADTFTLRGSDSSAYTAYTSGGTFSGPQRTLEFDADLTDYTLVTEVFMQPEV
jgi:hypothetical protein